MSTGRIGIVEERRSAQRLAPHGPTLSGREENRRLEGRSVGRGSRNLRDQLILPLLWSVCVSAKSGTV